MIKDYYKILHIEYTASDEDIKKAYRNLAKKYHPDANVGNPNADATFKEISKAYETLKDEKKKAEYDKKLFDKNNSNSDFQKDSYSQRKKGTSQREKQDVSPENFMNAGNLFEDFFGFHPEEKEFHFDSKDKNIQPMKTKDAFQHIFGKRHF